MADDGHELAGRRVETSVAGATRQGTVTAVTYTLKGGQPVAAVELDEPAPDGREEVAMAVDALTFIG